MALGKVESIDPVTPAKGTIKEDESEQVYPYEDKNFPSTGLKVGDPCTYTIDYSAENPVATDLKAYIPTEREITTVVEGPLTINTGETLKIKKGGMVKGNVTINNAILIIEDTGAVEGEVIANEQGNCVIRKGGMVKGNVTFNNGCTLKIVNKGNVKGNVTISSGNRFIVGNDNGGGTIMGSITVAKIRKVNITGTSVINCGA
ncbi:MAG: polymer-forming cytoskeletal protein [Bacteroidetes bacterium]|nr:polymer-forming cytoskeletal protein [Bacteroidota bacterium]